MPALAQVHAWLAAGAAGATVLATLAGAGMGLGALHGRQGAGDQSGHHLFVPARRDDSDDEAPACELARPRGARAAHGATSGAGSAIAGSDLTGEPASGAGTLAR